jgi:hypothetical protein
MNLLLQYLFDEPEQTLVKHTFEHVDRFVGEAGGGLDAEAVFVHHE